MLRDEDRGRPRAAWARDELVHLHLPAGRALRPPLPQPRRALRGPRPGRHDRADQVRRPVRHRPRRRVLDLRHADDHRRDQALLPRQGLGDPGAAAAPGAADADQRRHRRAHPAARPLPHAARAGRGDRVHRRGGHGGHRVRQRLLDALAGRRRQQRRRRRRACSTRIGIDDAGLEHVEIRESIKPLLEGSRRRGRSRSCCCGSSGT